MGVRKKNKAAQLKEEQRNLYFAKLNNCPTSPRKMRLVADMVRGMDVYKALNVLEYCPQIAASKLEKLLKSAIDNYEKKSEERADETLFIKTIAVDSGRVLKRVRPAPQGRAHRIRKRSNHVTMILDRHIEKVTKEDK